MTFGIVVQFLGQNRENVSKMALQKCNVNFSDFGRWISWGWIFEGALFIGKHRTKKFDPRIRPQNSGLKNSHPRIRPQIRVHEVQNPLCGNLPLRKCRNFDKDSSYGWTLWVIPPVRLGLSGRNCGKNPEKKPGNPLRACPGSPLGSTAGMPQTRHLKPPEHFQKCLPLSTAGDASVFQKWFQRGPLRAAHGIPSSTEGISDLGTHRGLCP